MQRQKSILSFFQKPRSSDEDVPGSLRDPPFLAKQNVSTSEKLLPADGDLSQEITGTETPPEKLPRRVFPVNGSIGGSSIFSSIMHKFVKNDSSEKISERENLRPETSTDHNKFKFINSADKKEPVLHIESDDDITGPETPGMRPLVPHIKKVQEDYFDGRKDDAFLASAKRVKLHHDSMVLDKSPITISDANSKFGWLDPSQIRDANDRKPDNPCYDKRTLHIPADALKKMSASQRQYWTVKCQYMDVLIFFKVVRI